MGAGYLIRRTFGVMRENGPTHLLSIGTIAIAFFLFASFLLLPLNFSSFLEAWEKKVQIILYLKDGVGNKRVLQLTQILQQETGVQEARYISRREAMESFQRDLAGYGGVLQGLEEEIFPASFEIALREPFRTPERIRALAARLDTIEEVEEVQYGGAWLERFSLFLYTLKWGVWILGVILVLIIVSVTANTVRLTLYNKRGEIEILKLVGARDTFVNPPFYREGGLRPAHEQGRIDVRTITHEELPDTPPDAFDCVILANVPASALRRGRTLRITRFSISHHSGRGNSTTRGSHRNCFR